MIDNNFQEIEYTVTLAKDLQKNTHVLGYIAETIKVLCPFSETLEFSTMIPQRTFLTKVQPRRLIEFESKITSCFADRIQVQGTRELGLWHELVRNCLNIIPCYVIRRASARSLYKDVCQILFHPLMKLYAGINKPNVAQQSSEAKETRSAILQTVKRCLFDGEVIASYNASVERFPAKLSGGKISSKSQGKKKRKLNDESEQPDKKQLEAVATDAKEFFKSLENLVSVSDDEVSSKAVEVCFPMLIDLYYEVKDTSPHREECHTTQITEFAGELLLILIDGMVTHLDGVSISPGDVSRTVCILNGIANVFNLCKERNIFLDGNHVIHPDFLRSVVEAALSLGGHFKEIVDSRLRSQNYLLFGTAITQVYSKANEFNASFLLGHHNILLKNIIVILGKGTTNYHETIRVVGEALQSSVAVYRRTRNLPDIPELFETTCRSVFLESSLQDLCLLCDATHDLRFASSLYPAFCGAPPGQLKGIWEGLIASSNRFLSTPQKDGIEFVSETLFLYVSMLCDLMKATMISVKSFGNLKELWSLSVEQLIEPLSALIKDTSPKSSASMQLCCSYQLLYVHIMQMAMAVGMFDVSAGEYLYAKLPVPSLPEFQVPGDRTYSCLSPRWKLKTERVVVATLQSEKFSLDTLPLQAPTSLNEAIARMKDTTEKLGLKPILNPVWQCYLSTGVPELGNDAALIDGCITSPPSGRQVSLPNRLGNTLLSLFQDLWSQSRQQSLKKADKSVRNLELDSSKDKLFALVGNVVQNCKTDEFEKTDSLPSLKRDIANLLELTRSYPPICLDVDQCFTLFTLCGAIFLVSSYSDVCDGALQTMNWLYPNVLRYPNRNVETKAEKIRFQPLLSQLVCRYSKLFQDSSWLQPEALLMFGILNSVPSDDNSYTHDFNHVIENGEFPKTMSLKFCNAYLRLVSKRVIKHSDEEAHQLLRLWFSLEAGKWEHEVDEAILSIIHSGIDSPDFDIAELIHNTSEDICQRNVPVLLILKGLRGTLDAMSVSTLFDTLCCLEGYEDSIEIMSRCSAAISWVCENCLTNCTEAILQTCRSKLSSCVHTRLQHSYPSLAVALLFTRSSMKGCNLLDDVSPEIRLQLQQLFEEICCLSNTLLLFNANEESQSLLLIECFLTLAEFCRNSYVHLDTRSVTLLLSSTNIPVNVCTEFLKGIMGSACSLLHSLLRYRGNICGNIVPSIFEKMRRLMCVILNSSSDTMRDVITIADKWNRIAAESVRCIGANSCRHYAVGLIGTLLKQDAVTSGATEKSLYDGLFHFCDSLTDKEWEELYVNLKKAPGAVAKLKDLKRSYEQEHKFSGKI